MQKYIFIMTAAFLFPMCSSKPSEPSQAEPIEKVEPKPQKQPVEKTEPKPEIKEAANPNVEWSKEMDELIEKTGELAGFADTKQCVKSHDEMLVYLGTHQKRLEELATRFMKMKHTVPLKDKEAFEKKKAEEYDKKMSANIATMAGFAMDCCNKELKHEDAWALEQKLEFIRILQSEKN